MNSRLLIPAVALLTVTTLAAANVRDDVRRSFEVGSAPARLIVDASGADVEVDARAGQTLDVVVEREARTDDADAARRQFANIETVITQEGDVVRVTVRRKSSGSIFSWGNQPRVDVKARVPASTSVTVVTSGGDVRVAGTSLPASVKTSGGDVHLAGVRGGSDVRTSGGDISVVRHWGPVSLHTSGGDIDAEGVDGDVTASTSGGDVTVAALGGFVNASTSGGDVTLTGALAGGSARTSGGDVRVDLVRSPSAPLSISSSGSTAVIRVGSDVAFELDAQSSGGGVSYSIPLTVEGTVERTRVRGEVNGGGELVTVRSSGGGIRLVPLG